MRTIITTEGGAPEWQDFTAWRDAQSGDDPKVPISPKDIAIQLYTSGTTGKPKGAMLSHANFLNLVQTGNEAEKPDWNKWTTDDVSLVAMPIFHIGGSGWGVMGLYHGARGVIAREFDPTKVLDFFEQSGITKLFMVPAAMQFVVRQPRARQVDFSRLKYMLYGASPIPAALLKECIEVFKCGFVQMYGMTETTGTIVALPPEDHVEGLDRMRSAGKALPGIELAILDADGKRLPPGEVGEIATRSGSNMVGYWNLPEATAKTLDSDGWLRTGDAGYMDKDGYLYIHDRIKDMIISGGENIYPAEVESAICDHPDVAEAAVIGIPDDKWGEAVKAIVVMKPGKSGDLDRHHQFYPRTHRRLQDAEVGRLHGSAAAQSVGQDLAAESARSVLGGEGSAGELSSSLLRPRASGHRDEAIHRIRYAATMDCFASLAMTA